MSNPNPATGTLTVIKAKCDRNFTIIPNSVFGDRELDWKALGLLCDLLHLPNGKRISLEWLSRRRPDGKTSTRSAINKLKELGYLSILRPRSEAGMFTGARWIVRSVPKPNGEAEPEAGFPHVDPPHVDPPQLDPPHLDKSAAGKPDTNTKTIKKQRTTTTEASSVDSSSEEIVVVVDTEEKKTTAASADLSAGSPDEEMHFPPQLSNEDRLCAIQMLSAAPPACHQKLLDELSASITKGAIRNSWLSWFRALIQRSINGEFHPDLGVEVAAARRREAEKASSRKRITPASPETASRHLADINALLGRQN
ncbi:hypothetical protein [Luteimonas sp. A478]